MKNGWIQPKKILQNKLKVTELHQYCLKNLTDAFMLKQNSRYVFEQKQFYTSQRNVKMWDYNASRKSSSGHETGSIIILCLIGPCSI